MDPVRAFVFDVFGTIVDWRSGVAREVGAFVRARGRSDIDPAAFADDWRRRYKPAMEEVRQGRRPFVPLDRLHRENLEAVLLDHGIDPANVPDPELEDLKRAWHRLDPWPDSVAGLSLLRQRFIVAPLSNGNVALIVNMAKRAGLPWDVVLGAELAQTYKPAPAVYLRAAALLDLPPEALCMVAAHNGDLAAARRCGLRTAFIPRPMEHGAGQSTDLEAEQDWDFVSADVPELARQVEN